MSEKKRPEGSAWADFCIRWRGADHQGKLRIAGYYKVTYDTAKHWFSESGSAPKQTKPLPEIVGVSQPLSLDVSQEPKTLAIINDTHNPYQDQKALDLVEGLLKEIQPDYLIYNGDVNDFYQISEFDKDPKRAGNLQDDIKSTQEMFQRHQELLPNTKKILLAGNHEDRLRRFLWSKAAAVSSLECLELPQLYNLEKYGIRFVPYEEGLLVNKTFLIIHGDLVASQSGYTAKRMMDKHGGSGICGHTHRGGVSYKRDRFGEYAWYENYCLCDLNPDYCKNPNWQQGFSLVHFVGHQFYVEQIPIVNGKLI